MASPHLGSSSRTGSFPVRRVGVLALLLAACANGSPQDPEPCPRRQPTFRVQIHASGATLPEDTRVTVEYGGSNVEGYDFAEQNGANLDVCCQQEADLDRRLGHVDCQPPLDASGVPVPTAFTRAIECELNTNGAARILVEASGYTEIEETLQADLSDREEWQHCDVLLTRDVFLDLQHGDAGVPAP